MDTPEPKIHHLKVSGDGIPALVPGRTIVELDGRPINVTRIEIVMEKHDLTVVRLELAATVELDISTADYESRRPD
jgi:hypothetical protein